jgi:hypothetical protein
METKIIQWIEDYQNGKSGIYPNQVALLVCAEFQISIEEARQYVIKHISSVLADVSAKKQNVTTS